MSDLEEALGREMKGIISVDDRLGSGSINYVQGVTAEVNGKKIEAVARIRRNYIEGIVANENEIWEKVVDDMRSSGDANEANIADIIEEARRQSYSTLAQGGVELDLSIERNNYGLAINTYRENITEAF